MLDKATFIYGILALLVPLSVLIGIVAAIARRFIEDSTDRLLITLLQIAAGFVNVAWVLVWLTQ